MSGPSDNKMEKFSERRLTCIMCPLGCEVTVKYDEKGDIKEVVGQKCPKGEKYARDEFATPLRVLTSTVRLEGGSLGRLPVRTSGFIPKDKMFDCMKEIGKIVAKPPVAIGSVMVRNILGLNVDIVATRDAQECREGELNSQGLFGPNGF